MADEFQELALPVAVDGILTPPPSSGATAAPTEPAPDPPKPFPWDDLLDDISRGEVIPVLGPGAITVEPGDQPFYPALVGRIAAAQKIGIPADYQPPSLHTLARILLEAGR